jgi:hypothetical protein
LLIENRVTRPLTSTAVFPASSKAVL